MSDFKGTNGPWNIKHSISKPAWNVVGKELGGRYKIARLPYLVTNDPEIDIKENQEQYTNAKLIASAPELLEMVILLVDRLTENGMGQFSAVKRAKELIEKVTN